MPSDDDILRDYTRVRAQGDMQIIEVGVIDWPYSHTPDLTWVEADRLPKAATADELERARRGLLQRRRLFVVCKECRERHAKGHTDDGVCHGCMERNHGVVF